MSEGVEAMQLRDYQQRGIDEIRARLGQGAHRVLAVAPTGAGKGTMAAHMLAEAAKTGLRVLFVVHRREIVRDIAARVRSAGVRVGEIHPRAERDPRALVQVASVQTLLRADEKPATDLLVVDEAHHYAADEWLGALAEYGNTPTVGFTATPQRCDGRALGDIFDSLVVVVSYSELLEAGHIVPCQVLRPPRRLGGDLAQDPVVAYLHSAMNSPAFVFARCIADAKVLCKRFRSVGVPTGIVTSATNDVERRDTMEQIADGRLTVVVTVLALTEGVDVSRVQTVVLARSCQHASTFVQIAGRALRPHKGKGAALLLDLTGASHDHGLPTDDRRHSLRGDGMGSGRDSNPGADRGEQRMGEVLGLELNAVHADLPDVATSTYGLQHHRYTSYRPRVNRPSTDGPYGKGTPDWVGRPDRGSWWARVSIPGEGRKRIKLFKPDGLPLDDKEADRELARRLTTELSEELRAGREP